MTQYETKPHPVVAMQWVGDNLQDLIIFLGKNIKIPDACTTYDEYAIHIKGNNSLVRIHDTSNSDGLLCIHCGEYIIKNGNGSITILTPTMFNGFYRKVESST